MTIKDIFDRFTGLASDYITPKTFEAFVERYQLQSNFATREIESLFPNTFYLEQIDDSYRREYGVFQCRSSSWKVEESSLEAKEEKKERFTSISASNSTIAGLKESSPPVSELENNVAWQLKVEQD